MTSESTTKKNIQKLQRAIVDGLEDVKAQDIQVFNTETLSPLFERVIVASGTSNRQTKALAASVRDAVREAGFDKPRTEGEDNGEWIIVDCGQAVVHVMQPTIRQYYRLEDIWGQTPVRLKHAAKAKMFAQASEPMATEDGAAKPKRSRAKADTAADAVPAKKPRLRPQPAAADGAAPARKPRTPARAKTGSAAAAAGAPKAAKAPAKKLQVVKVGAPVKKPAAATATKAAKPKAKSKA
ncbi:ribosome silencing factor [Macromonas bipunctata]|uniref:ribosome silencing factor n=1 Tax=Macromonas bipunctata TaxID=183670 RepID=UPI000C34461C|nr:ribosome silencing factor [Macromonas bipunctata]